MFSSPTCQSLLLLLARMLTPPPIPIAYCGHSLPAGLTFVPELKLKKKAQVFTPNTSKYHLPLIVSWLTWSHCVSVMVPFRPSHLGTAKVHPKSQYISGPPRPLTHFFSKYRNREYSEEGDQRRPPLKHRGPTHLWEVQLWGDVTRLPATFNRNEGWLHMPLLPGKVCCSPRDISASPLAKHQNT